MTNQQVETLMTAYRQLDAEGQREFVDAVYEEVAAQIRGGNREVIDQINAYPSCSGGLKNITIRAECAALAT